MLRQVSSRNQRVKGGFKMKNALKICLLVAVCVWLLYQMKHSHDKKKAFDDQSSKSSFQSQERPLGIRKFGSREDLPRAADAQVKLIGAPQTEDEEEGSDGDPDVEEEDHKGGRTKEADGGAEDREHDESSHKAREISFRGDDASSEVVHVVQEAEHEEASQEARERSFKADDASSAVESESENGGTRNLDNDESEKTDRRDPTAHSSSTSNESRDATPTEGRPDLRTASLIGNQTDDAAVLITNSTSLSTQRIYFQKNSTTVSVEWVEAPANLTAPVMEPANVSVSKHQTAAVPSVDGRANATKLEARGEEKPVIEQKTEATGEIPGASSAAGGIGNAVQVESESEKNTSGIQNRAESGNQEAATAK